MKDLCIIGNGFDVHHGIPSNYRQFGDFLRRHDNATYELVERYFAVDDDFWSEFEARLAAFDADTLIDNASNFLVAYGADDWSDAYHHDYQYELNRVVEGISVTMKARFAEWIAQLPIPGIESVRDKLVHLNMNASFLSFNYTPALGEIYGIAVENVFHIHGCASDPVSKIVLGHGWSPESKGSLNRGVNFEEADTRIVEGNHIIDRYFVATFKPTEEIIAHNQPFFAALAGVERISIMGHSLADVDLPYLLEIVRRIDARRVKWKVSYHDRPDAVRSQFAKLGIPESLVEFVRLSEF